MMDLAEKIIWGMCLTHAPNWNMHDDASRVAFKREMTKLYNENVKPEVDPLLRELEEVRARCEAAEGENAALRKALIPYADRTEWSHADSDDPWQLLFNSGYRDGHGWEAAQEALAIRALPIKEAALLAKEGK
jgi:hypothetical protein